MPISDSSLPIQQRSACWGDPAYERGTTRNIQPPLWKSRLSLGYLHGAWYGQTPKRSIGDCLALTALYGQGVKLFTHCLVSGLLIECESERSKISEDSSYGEKKDNLPVSDWILGKHGNIKTPVCFLQWHCYTSIIPIQHSSGLATHTSLHLSIYSRTDVAMWDTIIFEPRCQRKFGHSLVDQYHLKEKHENSDTSDQRKTQTSARPPRDIVANIGATPLDTK